MIRVIDIETTGTHPQRDDIIEIASADMVRGGGITNPVDTLVRPAGPIPPGASAVHHLIDEDVRNAPRLSEVVDRFKGAHFYVAHHAEFERSFFAAKGNPSPWICTYKCALRVWPELDGHSNQELRYALGRASPFPGFNRAAISPHRAASDVIITAAVFEELIKHARWSELVQWSTEPALHTRFHFGKYRGKRYAEIAASDPDYLRWIIEKSELEEGIKHSARHLAHRRLSATRRRKLSHAGAHSPDLWGIPRTKVEMKPPAAVETRTVLTAKPLKSLVGVEGLEPSTR